MKTWNCIIVVFFTFCLLALQSCYEDEGNYKYKDIGSVVIEMDNDIRESSSSQVVWQNEPLKVVPIIKLNGLEKDDLEFLWDCALKNVSNPKFTELSTEQNLDYVCKLLAGTYDLRLCVTDKNTGVSTYAYYTMTVYDVTDRTVLLLCKEGANDYDIYTCPMDAQRGVMVYKNGEKLYSETNGHTIKDANKLVFWYNLHKESFLWVLKSNGGETLSAFDFTSHGDATEWFFEEPAVIRPTDILGDVNGKEYFILSDGGVYFVDNNLAPPFKARNKAQVSDGSDYYIEEAAYLQTFAARRYAFWDKKNSRFLQWDYSAYCLKPFAAVDLAADPDSFDPNEMQGMTPVCFGSYDGGRYNPACSYNFFKDQSGKIHMYTFKGSATTINPDKHKVMNPAMGLDRASCILPFGYYNVIYYAIDNAIYVYDPNVPVNSFHPIYVDDDPDVQFTGMICRYNYGTLFVSAKKGNQYYVYRIYVEASGDPDPSKEVKAVGPFPEIVDMEILLRNS